MHHRLVSNSHYCRWFMWIPKFAWTKVERMWPLPTMLLADTIRTWPAPQSDLVITNIPNTPHQKFEKKKETEN